MNKRSVILFSVVFSLAAVLTALAQTQSPTGPLPGGPPSSGAPAGAPPEFQPSSATADNQGPKRYRVGPGDVLDVRVFGQSELNSTVEVDEDGNISSLPFLEDPLPAKCRNEKEIQKIITLAYSRYLRKPRVSVRILARNSRPPAVVYGAVRAPARVQMMRRVRLHELLVAAGGITQGSSGTIQIVHTGPEMCPQDTEGPQQIAASSDQTASRSALNKMAEASVSEKAAASFNSEKGVSSPASDKTVDASLSQKADGSDPEKAKDFDPDFDRERDPTIGQIQFYKTGDVRTGLFEEDPYIRPGDVVIVLEGEPIYVTGGVIAAAGLVMKDGMTLGRAIAMCGGLQRMAKSHEIHIYRLKKGKVGFEDLKFDYDEIRHGKKPDVLLAAFDIIDVRMYGQFHPRNLADYFLNITKGSVGGFAQNMQYRVLY